MKKTEVTKKKIDHQKNDSLLTDKNNKSIYILGDTMVKHVEEWKLKQSIDKDYNVYVRNIQWQR